MTADQQESQKIAAEALERIRAVATGRDDPRLLALEVDALLTLGRVDEAKPIIQKLWTSGYRDLALVDVLQRAHIEYPVNTEFSQELAARMN